ncbi:MAG TPA: response regulator [Polyangia bacterium]|nr:response regulator [Polyangia bacterium]
MRKILFVNDDDELAFVCGVILESVGHSVRATTSSRQALDELAAFSPDLVILDWDLGRNDRGDRLARALRRDLHFRGPIIMLSATPEAEALGRQAGVNAFVPKPFASDELLAAVRRELAHAEPRHAAP